MKVKCRDVTYLRLSLISWGAEEKSLEPRQGGHLCRGVIHASDNGPCDRLAFDHSQSQPDNQGASTSGLSNRLGLLASSQGSQGDADIDDDWVSLINPHLSQEERDELLSDDSQSEHGEQEESHKNTATDSQRVKWLESFPMPTSACANPPTIDKPMYSLIQSSSGPTKKKVLSHDRFLVRFQRHTLMQWGL